MLGTPLSPYCAVGGNVVPTLLPVLGSHGSVGRMYLVGKREAENAEGIYREALVYGKDLAVLCSGEVSGRCE